MLPTDLPVRESVRHGDVVSEEGVIVELAVVVSEEGEFVVGTEELPFNCVGVVGAEELTFVEDKGRAAPQTRHV